MRGLSLLDLLIILAVVALLVFAGSKDFVHYGSRTVPGSTTTSTASQPQGS